MRRAVPASIATDAAEGTDSMTANGTRVIDIDTHVLEPAALWERHLAP